MMKLKPKIIVAVAILAAIAAVIAIPHLGIRVVINNVGSDEIADLKLVAGSQSWAISALKPGHSFRKVIFPSDSECVLSVLLPDSTDNSRCYGAEYVEHGYRGSWLVDMTPQGVKKSQCSVRLGPLWYYHWIKH